jgi:hypothetical protein
MVFAADYSLSLAADDEGVTVGSLVPAAEEAKEDTPQQQEEPAKPAPAAAPAAPRHAPAAAVPAPEARPAASGREPTRAAPRAEADAAPAPSARGASQAIGLRQHLTGLPGVVWLRPGGVDEPMVIGVTPGSRYEPDRMTLLMLEPLIMQISGGLYQEEFTKVSAWIMANSDLISLVWEGEIKTLEEASSRVRKAPAPGWR